MIGNNYGNLDLSDTFAHFHSIQIRKAFIGETRGIMPMNTQLPEYLSRVTIKDMIIGEEAFTVPWSVQVDHEGMC